MCFVQNIWDKVKINVGNNLHDNLMYCIYFCILLPIPTSVKTKSANLMSAFLTHHSLCLG